MLLSESTTPVVNTISINDTVDLLVSSNTQFIPVLLHRDKEQGPYVSLLCCNNTFDPVVGNLNL